MSEHEQPLHELVAQIQALYETDAPNFNVAMAEHWPRIERALKADAERKGKALDELVRLKDLKDAIERDEADMELTPCPFCGGLPVLHLPTCTTKDAYDPSDRAYPKVMCGTCFATASGKNWDHHGTSAAAAWNARPLSAAAAKKEADGYVPTRAERDVIAERRRQVEQEGWTAQHDDDEHAYHQLARAAQGYVEHYTGRAWVFEQGNHDDYTAEQAPDCWPWDDKWWKPTDPRRDLVKAAALLVAEIERWDREYADQAMLASAPEMGEQQQGNLASASVGGVPDAEAVAHEKWDAAFDGVNWNIVSRDEYIAQVYADSETRARLIAAAPELLDYLNGMLGLVQLIEGRDDLPSVIRETLTTNHRYVDATAFVEGLES